MRFSYTGNLVVVVDPAVVGELIYVACQFAGDFSGALGALAAALAVDTKTSGVEGVWCGRLWMSNDSASGHQGEHGGKVELHIVV